MSCSVWTSSEAGCVMRGIQTSDRMLSTSLELRDAESYVNLVTWFARVGVACRFHEMRWNVHTNHICACKMEVCLSGNSLIDLHHAFCTAHSLTVSLRTSVHQQTAWLSLSCMPEP